MWPERKVITAEGNSSTVSSYSISAEQKYTSAKDTSLVKLESEPNKSLQSTSDSMVRDASPLKNDDNSSVQVDLDNTNWQSPFGAAL
jgi:hypothetical protein